VRRRFFVEKFSNNSASMEGEAAHHLGRVLRAQLGQLYELSDGTSAFVARVESVSRDRIQFALVEPLASEEVALDITLLLAVVKFDAFEWALEKATELGVSTIVPLAAARSEKSLVAAASKRSDRWQKILLESSQQSRRLKLPQLKAVSKPGQAFSAHKNGFCIMLFERSETPPIRRVLSKASAHVSKSAVLAIGPEGGWTEDELSDARSCNFHEASLGQLILRTETAVVSALSILNFALSPDS
jgi:16S rRNA (uracil1498-N3)-methyltransferase